MEKKRGITIFSKQAELQFGDTKMTLLDTPGHVDFSAEMERTLMVLDYAVLVISASDGVQAHTQTLWRLLKRYEIPVFLFINKMDQPGTDRAAILLELKKQLSDGCIDFTELGAGTEEEAQENEKSSTIMEEIAMEDETECGYYGATKLLLEYGADCNFQEDYMKQNGLLALRFYENDAAAKTLQLLLDYGTDLDIKQSDNKSGREELKNFQKLYMSF